MRIGHPILESDGVSRGASGFLGDFSLGTSGGSALLDVSLSDGETGALGSESGFSSVGFSSTAPVPLLNGLFVAAEAPSETLT